MMLDILFALLVTILIVVSAAALHLYTDLKVAQMALKDAQIRLRAEESLHAAEIERLKQMMRQALSEIDTFIATWRELYKTEFK
jgi:Flp pilus assembly protein TadG